MLASCVLGISYYVCVLTHLICLYLFIYLFFNLGMSWGGGIYLYFNRDNKTQLSSLLSFNRGEREQGRPCCYGNTFAVYPWNPNPTNQAAEYPDCVCFN